MARFLNVILFLYSHSTSQSSFASQTVARSCAEELDPEVLEESIEAIFKLAGLDHVRQTVVGNADIRGVSGGQKRRVKMLEMAVGTDVTVLFLDEITNGELW